MKNHLRPVLFLIVILIFITFTLPAQNSSNIIDYNQPNRKGKMFVFWGWNRSSYSNSDITFKGDNYNFKLDDVAAKDRQTPWDASIYLNPALITIPQTNFKIGYFINDHYAISAGVDHMKYVMVANQIVNINGSISNGSAYDGKYSNDNIVLEENFLTFEHTDGLNYLNVEIERVDDILKVLKRGKENLEINTVVGVGIGGLLPKTNAKLMDNQRYDDFNLAGYGFNAKIGLNITFYKYFFVQGELKGGFIHMPNIRTTKFEADKASQAFFFGEADILFGAIFRITK
jgi:hypothetical protein